MIPKITTKKNLNVGVLGCGPIAQAAHLEACRRGKNTSLYAICDLADDLRERMAVIHQPQVQFTSYEDMLGDPHVDLVIIATADAFHVEAAMDAIEAGKHVLVEKPLSGNLDECLTLQEKVRSAGMALQVAHMKRFDEGISFARQFIKEEMGEMLALKAWYCDSTHRYTLTDNVQPLIIKSEQSKKPSTNPKADKGRYYMMAHGSHLIDLALYLGGPIDAVRARRLEKFGAFSWFVDVAFQSGALGHLDLTVAVRMDWHEGFQVYGEFGSVIGKTYNPWLFKSSEVECFSEKEGVYHRPIASDGHFYRRQLEALAESILNGTAVPGTTIDEGVEVVRGMLAIARSVESGEWVSLNEVGGAL